MFLRRLKPVLTWGIILFVFNYILLFILMFLLDQTAGTTLWLPFNFAASIITSYNGVLTYGRVGNKEKTGIIKNIFLAIAIGWSVIAVSLLLFGLAALIFSGEFDFNAPGILVGAIGGLLARQKLQGKAIKFFGITI